MLLSQERKNPQVTIPFKSTVLLPKNTVFALVFTRNPLPFIKSNETFINSQIVTVFAYSDNCKVFSDSKNTTNDSDIQNSTGRNNIDYPMDADNFTVLIPWTYVPMILNDTFNNLCTVYSFDGMMWNQENRCIFDNSTNNNSVVLKCNTFGTFGVGCRINQPMTSQSNTTIIITTTGEGHTYYRTENNTNSKASSNLLKFSSLIIFFFGLLI